MVAWQIPLGNTVMRAENNTTGPLPGQPRAVAARRRERRAHLRAYVQAGFVGFLFGGGADGDTCACDAAEATASRTRRRSTATRAPSLSADDDGGFFRVLVTCLHASRGVASFRAVDSIDRAESIGMLLWFRACRSP